jgi:hypothetical protein
MLGSHFPNLVSYLQFAFNTRCFPFAATLSAEEARLWSVVAANSLDFNAWTALIDETEKNAEVMLVCRLSFKSFLTLWLWSCNCMYRGANLQFLQQLVNYAIFNL